MNPGIFKDYVSFGPKNIYHSVIEDCEEIGKILENLGYKPGEEDSAFKAPYEYFKDGSIVLIRYCSKDHPRVPMTDNGDIGRIIVINGGPSDIELIKKELPEDDSKTLAKEVEYIYQKELREIAEQQKN